MRLILALDLGVKTGFAIGNAGDRPRSGVVTLKRSGEHRSIAFASMISWLCEEFAKAVPAMLVKEAPLPLQASAERGNSEAAVAMARGLHGITEGIAVRFGVGQIVDIHPSTVRKHLLGTGRMGDRATTKAAVIDRCQLLGLMPRDCVDDNRADALATHDWAGATFFNRSASIAKLHLFGERAAR